MFLSTQFKGDSLTTSMTHTVWVILNESINLTYKWPQLHENLTFIFRLFQNLNSTLESLSLMEPDEFEFDQKFGIFLKISKSEN